MQTRIAFNAGEHSPELSERTDTDRYVRGCLALENWHVKQEGGVERRHGFAEIAFEPVSATGGVKIEEEGVTGEMGAVMVPSSLLIGGKEGEVSSLTVAIEHESLVTYYYMGVYDAETRELLTVGECSSDMQTYVLRDPVDLFAHRGLLLTWRVRGAEMPFPASFDESSILYRPRVRGARLARATATMGGISQRGEEPFIADVYSGERVADLTAGTEVAEGGVTEARCFPYVYSYDEDVPERYVIVLKRGAVTKWDMLIYTMAGELLEGFPRPCGGVWDGERLVTDTFSPRISTLRVKQINKLLFFVSKECEPWVLDRTDDGGFEFKPWEFKRRPWRYNHEMREHGILVRQFTNEQGELEYTVDFEEQELPSERAYVGQNQIEQPAEDVHTEHDTYPDGLTWVYCLYSDAVAKEFRDNIGFDAPESVTHRGFLKEEFVVRHPHFGAASHRQRGGDGKIRFRMYIWLQPRATRQDGDLLDFIHFTGATDIRYSSAQLAAIYDPVSFPCTDFDDAPVNVRTMYPLLSLVKIEGTLTSEDFSYSFDPDVFSIGEAYVQRIYTPVRYEVYGIADYLRASHYVEQKEVFEARSRVTEGVVAVPQAFASDYTPSELIPKGTRLAFMEYAEGEEPSKIYTCVAPWVKQTNYVQGLESPANYTANFQAAAVANDSAAYSCFSLSEVSSVQKGQQVAFKENYWRYFVAKKDVPAGTLIQGGPAADAEYFVRGLPVGEPVPCQSAWSTYHSNVWYGEYEVRRSYDAADFLSGEWESRGSSFSRCGSATNTLISGAETSEECLLQFVVLRSMYQSATDILAGFPSDDCRCSLIVNSYKHDTILTNKVLPSGVLVWTCEDAIKVDWSGALSVSDWSWWAFSSRYGGPACAEIFNQRLVFGGTSGQPQTIWLSRVNDLSNFMTGALDDASMMLTMSTTSQNPICWLQTKGLSLLVGTSDMEAVISSSVSGAALSSNNVRVSPQSHVGGASGPAVMSDSHIIFRQRGGRRVYETGYDFESDAFVSRDLTIFAAHIGREHGGFSDRFTMRRVPDTTGVFLLGDSTLALLTYNSAQDVKAWHRWKLGGSFVKIIDLSFLPNGNAEDALYLLTVDPAGSLHLLRLSDDRYEDAFGSYASLLVTSPLGDMQQRVADKQNDAAFYVRFGAPFTYDSSASNLMLSKDGGLSWYAPDVHDGVLAASWYDFKAPSNWCPELLATLRVEGSCGCNILAVQG